MQVGQEQAVGVALWTGGFQQMVGGAFEMGAGKCILNMKDFMKEMVNAPSSLMGFFLQIWSLDSCGGGIPERNGNCGTWSTVKASGDMPHCLIQRERIGQCQDRYP